MTPMGRLEDRREYTSVEIRDHETLLRHLEQGGQPEYVFFWGRKAGDTREVGPFVFSQWYSSLFAVDGITYATAEHWMMAEKARLMGDEAIRTSILASTDPAVAKQFGREVRNWDQAKWDAHKFEIVVAGNIAKFTQDQRLREYLLSTGDRVLVEASPYDRVWGIGLRDSDPDAKNPTKWRGKNLLGFALMAVREELRTRES